MMSQFVATGGMVAAWHLGMACAGLIVHDHAAWKVWTAVAAFVPINFIVNVVVGS